MRFPTFPTIFRTIYTLSNYSVRVSPQYKALQPLTRGTVLKSMPTIPFLSSFFSTSNSSKMSYPLQKSDDEWRAVLSKGSFSPPPCTTITDKIDRAIPRPQTTRHRSSRHRCIRQAHARYWRLYLRRLRRPSLQSFPQVQVWLRMARVLR